MPTPDGQWYSVAEFAAYHHYTHGGVNVAIKQGRIPAVKMGGFYCIARETYLNHSKGRHGSEDGVTMTEAARVFGVSIGTISHRCSKGLCGWPKGLRVVPYELLSCPWPPHVTKVAERHLVTSVRRQWREDGTLFWEQVNKDTGVFPAHAEGQCWFWTGKTSITHSKTKAATQRQKMYGRMGWRGKMWYAYELAWQLSGKPLPARGSRKTGTFLYQVCETNGCLNPDHWTTGTWQQMIDHRAKLGRNPTQHTHCRRGHEMTEDNVYRFGNTRRCRKCDAIRHQNYCANKKKKAAA